MKNMCKLVMLHIECEANLHKHIIKLVMIKIGPSAFVITLGNTNNKSYTSKNPKKAEDNRDFFR